MDSPIDRLAHVKDRIQTAARKSGRVAEAVTLVAVTKTVPVERILPFLKAGVKEVGENRVQEALAKSVELRVQTAEMRIHLIGPLQSNKAKKAVELFDVIQTLDRWSLAEELERHAASLGKIQECLVQIKISDEETKSGLPPSELPAFLSRLKTLSHLKITGLMGIPPLAATGEASRSYFARLKALLDSSQLEELSMGMSSDFEVAIEEGSTMVRIGSALFGARPVSRT